MWGPQLRAPTSFAWLIKLHYWDLDLRINNSTIQLSKSRWKSKSPPKEIWFRQQLETSGEYVRVPWRSRWISSFDITCRIRVDNTKFIDETCVCVVWDRERIVKIEEETTSYWMLPQTERFSCVVVEPCVISSKLWWNWSIFFKSSMMNSMISNACGLVVDCISSMTSKIRRNKSKTLKHDNFTILHVH